MLKLNTILFHNNLWSLGDNSFSLLERHVCPIQMLSAKSSIRLYQTHLIWHLNSSTGLENRKRGQQEISLQEISWRSLHVKGTSTLEAKSLGSKVARNSWHPNQTSSDVHCQVDKLVQKKISFTIKYFRPISLPMSFPTWEPFQSSALLWVDPMQGKGPLLSWLFYILSLRRNLSQQEGIRQSTLSTSCWKQQLLYFHPSYPLWVPTFLFPGNSLCLTPASFSLVWNERQLTATGRQGEHKKIRNLCWAVWEANDRRAQARLIWIPGGFGRWERHPIPICSFLFPPLKPGTQGRQKSRETRKGHGKLQYATGQGRKEIVWRRFN